MHYVPFGLLLLTETVSMQGVVTRCIETQSILVFGHLEGDDGLVERVREGVIVRRCMRGAESCSCAEGPCANMVVVACCEEQVL